MALAHSGALVATEGYGHRVLGGTECNVWQTIFTTLRSVVSNQMATWAPLYLHT